MAWRIGLFRRPTQEVAEPSLRAVDEGSEKRQAWLVSAAANVKARLFVPIDTCPRASVLGVRFGWAAMYLQTCLNDEKKHQIGFSGMVRPRPTPEAGQTPPYGFRIPQQNASVHADPWSSGVCHRKCPFRAGIGTKTGLEG